MDRSMKVMFGMMTIAICLLAFTMMGNQSQQAYAGEYVGGGDRGTELTIVSFRVIDTQSSHHVAYRMWSDGAVEVNFLGQMYVHNGGAEMEWYQNNGPGFPIPLPEGWILVTDSVAGYACVGDTDGNRSVDITDMLAVFDNWGQCEEDPPLGLPDDDDLM